MRSVRAPSARPRSAVAHRPQFGARPRLWMTSKKNFCRFTRLQDDYLIQLVSAYPVIYDPNHQCYKDLSIKDNAWKDISSSIKKSVEQCKVRWRSIRDLYNRKKKEMLRNPGSARAIKWEYMEQLGFLDRTSNRKLSMSKMDDDEVPDGEGYLEADLKEEERDFEEDICQEEDNLVEGEDLRPNPIEPEIKIVPKKRRRVNGHSLRASPYFGDYEDSRYSDRDPISLFFKSMAQTVMTFPPTLAAEAKERVCRIITSLEYRAHSKTDRYAPSETSSKDGMSHTDIEES